MTAAKTAIVAGSAERQAIPWCAGSVINTCRSPIKMHACWQEALVALEAERSHALRTLKELRARQGKGLLTRLVTEQRFTLALPQKPNTAALQIPEVKRYDRMLSP